LVLPSIILPPLIIPFWFLPMMNIVMALIIYGNAVALCQRQPWSFAYCPLMVYSRGRNIQAPFLAIVGIHNVVPAGLLEGYHRSAEISRCFCQLFSMNSGHSVNSGCPFFMVIYITILQENLCIDHGKIPRPAKS
jgi:hypothetical protein